MKTNEYICPECGKVHDARATRCSKCGHKLTCEASPPVEPQAPDIEETDATPPPAPEPERALQTPQQPATPPAANAGIYFLRWGEWLLLGLLLLGLGGLGWNAARQRRDLNRLQDRFALFIKDHPTPTPTPTATPTPTPVPTLSGFRCGVNADGQPECVEPLTGMVLVWIEGGCFTMGSPASEEGRSDTEGPRHKVCLQDFWMGKYEVTQVQWQAVMGDNPSYFKGVNRPVEQVSWDDVREFIERLNARSGTALRLPSEAEWEYACRAGSETPFAFGATITPDLANYDGRKSYAGGPTGVYRSEATNVGAFAPNAFGLYDMHGNVWERCADGWHDNYAGAPDDGSVWDSKGEEKVKVVRGGSWGDVPHLLRCACRGRSAQGNRGIDAGFRVACAGPLGG